MMNKFIRLKMVPTNSGIGGSFIAKASFKHNISNFEICGMPVNHDFIHINYDRCSNILIGMDILKDWDIHISTIRTGETILLACPIDQLNSDYYNEIDYLMAARKKGISNQ